MDEEVLRRGRIRRRLRQILLIHNDNSIGYLTGDRKIMCNKKDARVDIVMSSFMSFST